MGCHLLLGHDCIKNYVNVRGCFLLRATLTYRTVKCQGQVYIHRGRLGRLLYIHLTYLRPYSKEKALTRIKLEEQHTAVDVLSETEQVGMLQAKAFIYLYVLL